MTSKEIRGHKSDKMLLKFYLTSMLSNAMFYLPTLVYFFTAKVANPLNVSILISLKSVATFICEVPTGFIADKYGRKISILIGMIINMLSLILLIVGNDFIIFAIAQCLFGIAETFRSGSDSAMLYDNLKCRNETEKFEQSTQKNYIYVSIMVVMSYILGGYIYEANEKFPFIASLLLLIVAFLVFMTFEEHPYKSDSDSHLSIRESIYFLRRQSDSIWPFVIFGNIIIGICISTYVYFAPILLTSYELSGKYFGYIFSFGILSGAICVKFTDKIKDKDTFISSIAPLVITTMCMLAYVFNTRIVIILYVIGLRLVWGLFSVIYTIVMNQHVSESSIRATIISIGNGIVGLASVVNTIVFGVIMKYVMPRMAMIYLILVMIMIMLLFSSVIRKSKEVARVTNP